MNRWNIHKIVFYSHDGRRRDVNLDINSVNIITGRSQRGKSALTEVIDYVMSAGECNIPVRVRDSSSWVGLLWGKDNTQCFICRRLPQGQQKSNSEVYFESKGQITIPETEENLTSNTNPDGSLRKFEQLLGMGAVETEATASYPAARISLRNAMPFVLQDDDVIISKSHLLRGSNDERRHSIIATLPYFLGVVDETSVAKENKLKRLRTQLSNEEKKIAAAKRITGEGTERARALLSEAAQVGLSQPPSEDDDLPHLLESLRGVSNWTASDAVVESNNELNNLYEIERRLNTEINRLRAQIRSANEMISAATGFSDSTQSQINRLQVVELITNTNSTDSCPLCEQRISDITDTVSSVRAVFDRVSNDLRQVSRERPRLDQYIQERELQIQELREQISGTRSQISALVSENETIQQGASLDQRRFRVVGRISLFLEAEQLEQGVDIDTNIEQLTSEIRLLEDELNNEAKEEALDNVRIVLSKSATDIIKQLPFDYLYRDASIDFNPKNLSVGVITPQKRETMRSIGADENYLSFHIAFILAFHRHFARLMRPVPGVLLIDQLSRPFFPQDPDQDEIVISSSGEREDLKKYFDLLFSEVKREEGLQVIILEHAYFSDDAQFVAATKERWNNTGLIPEDWPSQP